MIHEQLKCLFFHQIFHLSELSNISLSAGQSIPIKYSEHLRCGNGSQTYLNLYMSIPWLNTIYIIHCLYLCTHIVHKYRQIHTYIDRQKDILVSGEVLEIVCSLINGFSNQPRQHLFIYKPPLSIYSSIHLQLYTYIY